MYIPKHFAIDGTAACHRVIVENGFGELVTLDDAGLPFASHLPFLIDPARGTSGTLIARMARANPQWQHFTNGKPVLAMYLGSMMRGIVAFEIPIDRLEGKAKLSQNRDAADQARVAEALAASGNPSAQATSKLIPYFLV